MVNFKCTQTYWILGMKRKPFRTNKCVPQSNSLVTIVRGRYTPLGEMHHEIQVILLM